jgi:hypothetical protein
MAYAIKAALLQQRAIIVRLALIELIVVVSFAYHAHGTISTDH